jgi:hypothetical protein
MFALKAANFKAPVNASNILPAHENEIEGEII